MVRTRVLVTRWEMPANTPQLDHAYQIKAWQDVQGSTQTVGMFQPPYTATGRPEPVATVQQ